MYHGGQSQGGSERNACRERGRGEGEEGEENIGEGGKERGGEEESRRRERGRGERGGRRGEAREVNRSVVLTCKHDRSILEFITSKSIFSQ